MFRRCSTMIFLGCCATLTWGCGDTEDDTSTTRSRPGATVEADTVGGPTGGAAAGVDAGDDMPAQSTGMATQGEDGSANGTGTMGMPDGTSTGSEPAQEQDPAPAQEQPEVPADPSDGATQTPEMEPDEPEEVPADMMPDAMTESAGACDNEADSMVLDSISEMLEDTVTQCATRCFLDPARSACIAECAFSETSLSAECRVCFGDIFDCTLARCTIQCAAGSDSSGCVNCRAEHCNGPFEACAGISATQ